MKKGYIFDLDGTLLDSMYVWDGIGTEYLLMKKKTPKESRCSLNERFNLLTLHEVACFLKERYDIAGSLEEMVKEITSLVRYKYHHELLLKSSVKETLQILHENGCKLCVVTATDHENAEAALKRNGVADYFTFILSTEDCKLNKRGAEIFHKAVKDLGLEKEQCVVVEDALHAIYGAKKADLCVYAMYDEHAKQDWEEIQQVADQSFLAMNQMEV